MEKDYLKYFVDRFAAALGGDSRAKMEMVMALGLYGGFLNGQLSAEDLMKDSKNLLDHFVPTVKD